MKKLSKDQKEKLKFSIEKVAKQNGVTIIRQIVFMQSLAMRRDQHQLIEILDEIKQDYIDDTRL